MAERSRPAAAVRDLMSYQDIADALQVKVTSVYQYALRDPEFPGSATNTRSPLFHRRDIETWQKVRKARGENRPGRPRKADRAK